MAVSKKRNSSTSEKKPLRSCARCRKNKTKCDSTETRPNPCSSCAKKGLECHVDYVNPPQRSREMKVLCESISFAKEKISSLCDVYEKFLKDVVIDEKNGFSKETSCPTRVLKFKEQFFVFNIDEDHNCLYVNNFKIDLTSLEDCLENLRKVLSNLMRIYFKWDNISDFTVEEYEIFISQFTLESIIQRNQLLLLLCILNFYFDIPNLKYLEMYDYVIESYCKGASRNNDSSPKWLSKSFLARLIIGDMPSCQFHSELFIKHFTIYLFLHVVLYGPQYFMTCFMEKYIRTLESLRKKINFDKNWEVKWVNFYIRLLNLVELELGVENEKKDVLVEEEELEFMFNGVIKETDFSKIDSLDCFICLVKFDQFLIEQKRLPSGDFVKIGLLKLCRKLEKDLCLPFNGFTANGKETCERLTFVEIFFTQLLSLNKLLCVDDYKSLLKELKEVSVFNGFNHVDVEIIPFYLGKTDGEREGFYWCQSEYNLLSKSEILEDNLCALRFVELAVGKHYSKIKKRENLLEVIKNDFEAYSVQDDMSLKILKSSCRLIWYLYEQTIYINMLNKCFFYEPFIWNPQLLLENNGLSGQSDDSRGNDLSLMVLEEVFNKKGIEMGSVDGSTSSQMKGGINKILQDVDWVKDSADDVLRKIHGVLN